MLPATLDLICACKELIPTNPLHDRTLFPSLVTCAILNIRMLTLSNNHILASNVDNSAYVSQADIQLSGPTSQMKLEVYSKKAILFQGLVQRFSALLKEVEGSRKITY